MFKIRKSDDRGITTTSWLRSRHTFSFGSYYNSEELGFGPLRVINEDIIEPGTGFPMRPHDNMEVIFYTIAGRLEYQNNLGGEATCAVGEVQVISAGTGIAHSEFNPDIKIQAHILQIWILPEMRNTQPKCENKLFDRKNLQNNLELIASRGGKSGSLNINQDADIYACILHPESSIAFTPVADRLQWVQIVSGSLNLNGTLLEKGDGAGLTEQEELVFTGIDEVEFLLFDMDD